MKIGKKLILLGLLFAPSFASAAAASGSSGAPLGKRVYVLGSETEGRLVEIRKAESGAGGVPANGVLRDPVLPGSGAKGTSDSFKKVMVPAQSAGMRPRPPRVREIPVAHPTRLNFRPVVVQGKPLNPEVNFDSERVQVGRADEPLKHDFYPKIFETERQGF